MVFAVELPAPLHGRHVPWVRHHADHRVIPLGRGTDGAQPPGGKIAAYGAVGDGALGGNDGVRKRLSVLLRQAQYMKGQPLGGLSTDPRQTGKLFDQRLQRRGKILHELKTDEFAELYADEIKGEGQISGEEFVEECQVESDLELLLPANYVTGSSERMLLYRELDGLTLDKDVEAFRSRLEDRFGPVPRETEELLRIVPLRRLSARLGAEKIFLKGGRMTLFFVSNPDSPFYQSKAFGKVIDYMMKYTRRCDLREQNGRRSMLIKNVTNVETAVSVLQEIVALPVKEE